MHRFLIGVLYFNCKIIYCNIVHFVGSCVINFSGLLTKLFPSKIALSNISICALIPCSNPAPQLQTSSQVSWWQHSCFSSRILITTFGQDVWCLWWIRVHACAAHLRVILSVVATIPKQILPIHSLKRQFLAHVCKNWEHREYVQ
jgi:hypothetical protein